MSPDSTSPHVLIINQHGDNRGDEAALRAMLQGISDGAPGARFTILHQFSSPASKVTLPHEVTWLPIIVSPIEATRLAGAFLLKLVHLPDRWLAGRVGRAVIDAYRTADVVISAPGGPYIGDLYAGHEPVHWFYVWMAWAHRRPLVLYAPSAGPFSRRLRNPLRRWTLRRFDRLATREHRSAAYIERLLRLPAGSVEVTADSAFQRPVTPLDRATWRDTSGSLLGDRFLLVVSALRWRWPGHPDPAAAQRRYDDAVVDAIRAVAARQRTHVVFPPQLHGPRHSDRDYLLTLADQLPPGISVEVLPEDMDSDAQRARVAAADLVLASRYHPAIFAVSAGVPLVCIAYEHKAVGLMESAGLHGFVVEIDEVTSDKLVPLIEAAVDEAVSIRAALDEVRPALAARSARTTQLVLDILNPR